MDEIEKFLATPNYYAAMNLDRKAITQKQVQESYRKLAKQFHPDKNKNPKATEAFSKLNEIKETLSNDRKRIDYNNRVFPPPPPIRRVQSMPINSMRPEDLTDKIRAFYKAEKTNKSNFDKKTQRKNIFYPFIGIMILFLIFTFISNTEPYSSSITKESLKKIITFSREDSFQHSEYRSKVLGVSFFVPKDWERENLYDTTKRNNWVNLREQLCSFADDIYIGQLREKCDSEKKSSNLAHPTCWKLKQINLP